jgi:hypothetical protein
MKPQNIYVTGNISSGSFASARNGPGSTTSSSQRAVTMTGAYDKVPVSPMRMGMQRQLGGEKAPSARNP